MEYGWMCVNTEIRAFGIYMLIGASRITHGSKVDRKFILTVNSEKAV